MALAKTIISSQRFWHYYVAHMQACQTLESMVAQAREARRAGSHVLNNAGIIPIGAGGMLHYFH